MRFPPFLVTTGLFTLIAASAAAVTMDWTPIGNPGNACDLVTTNIGPGCFGAVAYPYYIGTYEVTNAQYAEFLNAKASTDPFGLYDSDMGAPYSGGGITQSGASGHYAYSVRPGTGDLPVNFVSHYDAMRFANWMNNGQGSGDTETGAYTFLGPYTTLCNGCTAVPSNGATVTRNATATIFLPTEDEWYKAAYYSAITTSYFDYPAGSDVQTVCSPATAEPNHANCGYSGGGEHFNVGSYTGSASPYGTLDQGGNVWEMNETILSIFSRGLRGGSSQNADLDLAVSSRKAYLSAYGSDNNGFRLAMVPEPSTGLLVVIGLLGFAVGRRASA